MTALVVSPAAQPLAIAVEAVLGLESLGAPHPVTEAGRRAYGPYAAGLLPRGSAWIPLLDVRALVEVPPGGAAGG